MYVKHTEHKNMSAVEVLRKLKFDPTTMSDNELARHVKERTADWVLCMQEIQRRFNAKQK